MSYSIHDLIAQIEAIKATIPPLAQPELPEFAFTKGPKYLSRAFLCVACDEPIHEKRGQRNHWYRDDVGPFHAACLGIEPMAPIQGPMPPPTLTKRRLVKRELTAFEQAHHEMRTALPGNIPEHSKTPKGTVPPLEGLGHFLSRVDEINAIAATQFLDLPTVGQELAQTGLASVTISSSGALSEDDDTTDVDDALAERHACRYGTAYTIPDPDLMLRIDWEKYIYGCGPITRIWLAEENGQMVTKSSDKQMDPTTLNAAGFRLWKSMGKPPIEDIEANRDRAKHYGVLGSILYGVTKGEHEPEQDVNNTHWSTDPSDDGPKELGLHELDPLEGLDQNEPTEEVLWPIDVEELALLLMQGAKLQPIEWRWLERNPEAYEALAAAGLVS